MVQWTVWFGGYIYRRERSFRDRVALVKKLLCLFHLGRQALEHFTLFGKEGWVGKVKAKAKTKAKYVDVRRMDGWADGRHT